MNQFKTEPNRYLTDKVASAHFYERLQNLITRSVGFIIGLIYGAVYNLAAGVVGGIELELDSMDAGYAAPPPPQWNNAGQYPGQPGQQQYPY